MSKIRIYHFNMLFYAIALWYEQSSECWWNWRPEGFGYRSFNKKAHGEREISIPFIEVFMEACIIQRAKNEKLVDNKNPSIRYQILENLFKSGYVSLNPKEDESI